MKINTQLKRLISGIIDFFLILILVTLLTYVVSVFTKIFISSFFINPIPGILNESSALKVFYNSALIIISVIIPVIYYYLSWSSIWYATPAQKLLGLEKSSISKSKTQKTFLRSVLQGLYIGPLLYFGSIFIIKTSVDEAGTTQVVLSLVLAFIGILIVPHFGIFTKLQLSFLDKITGITFVNHL